MARETISLGLHPSSFLFLVVRPGATSSVLAPSSDALATSSDEAKKLIAAPQINSTARLKTCANLVFAVLRALARSANRNDGQWEKNTIFLKKGPKL